MQNVPTVAAVLAACSCFIRRSATGGRFFPVYARAAVLLSRPLLGFPGALLEGLAFFAYARCRENTLVRLKARNHFFLTGAAFVVYAVLGGLVLPDAGLFPAWKLNASVFLSATGFPVQLFRALCAIAIFYGILGVIRIFREGALQAAQQELLDIIEFFPDATFVVDSGRRIIAWNLALERMTGIPKSEMLGRGDFAYSVPFLGKPRPMLIDLLDGADPEVEKLYKCVRRGVDGSLNAEAYMASLYGGTGAYVWLTASPLRDSDGNVYGAIESLRDVTDRKLAEEALRRSEMQFRTLIETANTGFHISDGEGRVLDANLEYVRLSGHRSLAEIRGRSLMEWIAPYEEKRGSRFVERCLREGFVRNFEIDYVDRNGQVTPVELNATLVRTGSERRILTLCRDITEGHVNFLGVNWEAWA